jgi:RNA polymerase sigma factor (sigma-70 family)
MGKEITIMTAEAGPAPGEAPVTDLVMRACDGDQRAWDAIVERYAPLVWAICRRYRLAGADADDAGQAVWLQLVDHIGQIRDPAALPGWLATTTGRECGRIVRAARRSSPPGCHVLDAEDIPDEHAPLADDQLLAAERHAALREALADLPPPCQRLITLLAQDPPPSYAQISAQLGIPVGSIGPTRRRCLAKLCRHPAIAAMANTEPASLANEPPGPS